jgi:hypothetical protein
MSELFLTTVLKTRDRVIYTEVGSNYIPPLHTHTRLVQTTAVQAFIIPSSLNFSIYASSPSDMSAS